MEGRIFSVYVYVCFFLPVFAILFVAEIWYDFIGTRFCLLLVTLRRHAACPLTSCCLPSDIMQPAL